MTILDLRQEARTQMPCLDVPEPLRHVATLTWRARMVQEHGSSHVFIALASQFERCGLPGVTALRTFADEERAHGVLCGAVVEALGGDARAPASPDAPFPVHADATPLEGALRNLLSVSCLSETVAVALIGAERLEMPPGELRTLLTRIYADECGHARFGWHMLPRLLASGRRARDASLCDRLGEYLTVAFAALEAHELAHLPRSVSPSGGAALGLCSGVAARTLFYSTVEQVILPGLESYGLAARDAWRRRGDAGLLEDGGWDA